MSTISFDLRGDDADLLIFDRIERRGYTLRFFEPIELEPISIEHFNFPVDAGISIHTSSLTLPTVPPVYLRDATGTMLTELTHFVSESFPVSEYIMELCTPIKIYFQVEAGVTLSADEERAYIEFDKPTELVIGARSKHDRPNAIIETSESVVDVFAAISTFGSALKTLTAERSYPTLRGHPPLIECGDSLDIPAHIRSPDSGVRIEVPPTFRHAYACAPLVYYFGAELVSGSKPRLVCDNGFEHSLEGPQGFERKCERTLKQAFFLDCLTRTEGHYTFGLYQRHILEDTLDLDYSRLYGLPLEEQLVAYFEIPYETIAPEINTWNRTTHVVPIFDSVETIPFIVNDLSGVRTYTTKGVNATSPESVAIGSFYRNSPSDAEVSHSFHLDNFRFDQNKSADTSAKQTSIEINPNHSIPVAFRNRFDRTLSDGVIDVTVVCNDPKMAKERTVVESVYGSDNWLPFEVQAHRVLAMDELARVLAAPSDFFHYIGHIDDEGFECVDGTLVPSTLDRVGTDAFFLNACQSYEHAINLINAGAIGGLATVRNIVNSSATRIGATIARLLNNGFTLTAALEVARVVNVAGYQYVIIGDGELTITQAENSIPLACDIKKNFNQFEVAIRTFTTTPEGIGSVTKPYLKEQDLYYLNPGVATLTATKDELQQFFNKGEFPVTYNDNLYWSSEVDLAAL